jgi:hypothetical protein
MKSTTKVLPLSYDWHGHWMSLGNLQPVPWARSSAFSDWILLPTTHSDKVLVLVSKWHEDWF